VAAAGNPPAAATTTAVISGRCMIAPFLEAGYVRATARRRL
jgi:hypothetical protein